jgi:hypothetical protein
MLKRSVILTMAAIGLIVTVVPPTGSVMAKCLPTGSSGDGRIFAGVPCPPDPPSPQPDSPTPSPGPVCTPWHPLIDDPTTSLYANIPPDQLSRIAADGSIETYSTRQCDPGGPQFRWISSPTPKSVANTAFGDLKSQGLPTPVAKTGPPLDKMIVNFETWIAVDPIDPISVQANAGGITSTVTATPVGVEFRTGTISTKDVALITCKPWGSIEYGACTWTPQFPSVEQATGTTDLTYHGSISLVWDITWTSNTGPTGNLGQLTTTTPLQITVMEIQTIGSG